MGNERCLNDGCDIRPMVDVHGSCVSFSAIKNNTVWGKQRQSDVFKNNYFFSHVNHWGVMTEPFPMLPEEEEFGEIIQPHGKRVIMHNLSKDVLEKLEESNAEWLMLDFYDSARIQWFYPGGWFTHYMDMQLAAPSFYERAKSYIQGAAKLDLTKDTGLMDYINRYMDRVIAKYGVNHIILNRVAISRYVITDKRELGPFAECTEQLGSWKDNQRIREIEEYVLDKYPIAYVDISKFFVADWSLDHDYFSVHFEPEYYEYANRAFRKILEGETTCVQTLDELAFAYKLDKNMTTPEGKDNWKNYIRAAESVFSVNSLADELIAGFSLDELATYRHALAKMYRFLDEKREYFYDETISRGERQEQLIEYFEKQIE